MIARIEDVHLAAVRSLFTDASELYPQPNAAAWWEVWIRDGRLASFRIVAGRLNIPLKDHAIRFPERDVVLAHGTEATIARVVSNSNAIAELRLAKDTPSIFLEMGAPEQVEWAEDLVGRLVAPDMLAPAICLLDSGATREHPLIAPALRPATSMHTTTIGVWAIASSGTGMARRCLAWRSMAISSRRSRSKARSNYPIGSRL